MNNVKERNMRTHIAIKHIHNKTQSRSACEKKELQHSEGGELGRRDTVKELRRWRQADVGGGSEKRPNE